MSNISKEKFQELNKNAMNWLLKKDELIKESRKLKEFLSTLIGSTIKIKNAEYKIVEIVWDDLSSLFGGNIKCQLQSSNCVYKFFVQTEKFIRFEEFYIGLNEGKILIKESK
jgi:hypothetical protein